jgi:hypothetical protein
LTESQSTNTIHETTRLVTVRLPRTGFGSPPSFSPSRSVSPRRALASRDDGAPKKKTQSLAPTPPPPFLFATLRGATRPSEHRRRALLGPQCGVMSVFGSSFEMYALPNAHPDLKTSPPPKHPFRKRSTAAVAAGNASQLRLSFTPFRYRYTADQSPPLRTAGSNGAKTTESLSNGFFRDLGANAASRTSREIAGAARSRMATSDSAEDSSEDSSPQIFAHAHRGVGFSSLQPKGEARDAP